MIYIENRDTITFILLAGALHHLPYAHYQTMITFLLSTDSRSRSLFLSLFVGLCLSLSFHTIPSFPLHALFCLESISQCTNIYE